MNTAQKYSGETSPATLLSSTAYRVVTILFNDHLRQQTGPIAEWFTAFQLNVFDVLNRIGFSQDEASYILRSQTFCLHVQQHANRR